MAGGYMPAIARDAVLQEAVHLDLRVRRHMLLNIPVSIPLNIPANTRFSMVVKLLFLAIPVKPHLRIALNITCIPHIVVRVCVAAIVKTYHLATLAL